MPDGTGDPGDIDRRLAELDQHEAEYRASRRALLEVGLQIDQLRRDKAGIAARTEALRKLDEAKVKARSVERASRSQRETPTAGYPGTDRTACSPAGRTGLPRCDDPPVSCPAVGQPEKE